MKTLNNTYGTTYTDLKEIKSFCDTHNIDDWKEVTENILNEGYIYPSEYRVSDDFEVNGYRFIRATKIDEIQTEELKSDLYILGCFNASFISDNTNLPLKVVQALQKAECYEELGELMLDYIDNIQREYARLDGYGHHFAHYDHVTIEDTFNGTDYYIFRVN